MSDAPLPSLQVALSAAEQRGYHAVIVGEHALRIVGRFGDPTLGALELMVGADAPLGIQADGTEGHRSGLCLWTGPDLYAVTLGEGGRWEHFHVEQGLGVLRDSWRGGARGRYRVPHGPLVQPIPDVIALAFHVTVWDYLGWKDTLADPKFTARQKAYAKIRGDRQVYTPQIVVNGHTALALGVMASGMDICTVVASDAGTSGAA